MENKSETKENDPENNDNIEGIESSLNLKIKTESKNKNNNQNELDNNINLNCVLGTKKDGEYKSFLEEYEKQSK